MEEERDVMEVDVLFVGAGIASLSGALHLTHLIKQHNDKVAQGGEGKMLDEVMIKALLAEEVYAVTVEITVKFRRPLRTGEKVRFLGRVTGNKGRVYFTEGEALGDDAKPYATATAKYIEARAELRRELMQSVE